MKFLTFWKKVFTQNIPIKLLALCLAAAAVILLNAI